MDTERRRFRRFLAKDMAFAVFRPHFTKLGKIKDISRGGMAFEYVTFEGPKEDTAEMDIFVSGVRIHLPRMPVRTIYDKSVVNDHYTFSPFVERRRCGVQFGDLTNEQVWQLKHFLETHTTGLTP